MLHDVRLPPGCPYSISQSAALSNRSPETVTELNATEQGADSLLRPPSVGSKSRKLMKLHWEELIWKDLGATWGVEG